MVGTLEMPDGWLDGKIEVNINRCNECFLHYHYSRHSEDEHVNQFNSVGDAILGMFPNALIIGNYEKVAILDEFEVYIRGLGFKSQRDPLDRYFLYRKSQKARFPENFEVLD